MKKLLTTLCFTAGLVATGSATTIYDANEAFKSAVADPAYTSTFGNYSVGYVLPGGSFTAFTNADKTDGFPTGSNAGDVKGFRIDNNAFVPAAVVNTTDHTVGLSFGSQLASGEILLHPGGLGNDSFNPPIADAVLRFTAPKAAYYSLTALFSSLHPGQTQLSIFVDGVLKYSGVDAGSFASTKYKLATGETIDFVVGPYTDGIGSDSTGLYAKVAMPDNGSTVMLLGLAFVGMAAAVHFRRGAIAA